MKALVCRVFGGPETLRLEEVETPICGENDLLVDVVASGLNFADLVVLRGHYQGQKQPPLIPGFEVYGIVAEAGSGTRGFQVGDRVIGQVWDGGFGERVLMNPATTITLPFHMPAADAGAFYINYGTAYSAIVERGGAKAGDCLLVLGAAGGVGLAAVQLGRALGLRVLADCRGMAKQELVRTQGADHVVDHRAPDFIHQVQRATEGHGCDLVIDMIGGAATKAALKVIAHRGRLVIVGFAGGEPYLVPANHLLVKNCTIIGHWWGDLNGRNRTALVEMFDVLFKLYREQGIRPYIDQCMPVEGIPFALERYKQREVKGKMVCIWS